MQPPRYSATFLRAFRRLRATRQESTIQAIETLFSCLEQNRDIPSGLGLKKLDKTYWEIRSTLADRIIFEWLKDEVTFRIIGSHDEVRRFLKRH